MSLFVISRHKRFAVRQQVQLRCGEGNAQNALLIELSLHGCRVSVTNRESFQIDQAVTIEIEGFGDIRGHIRSAGEGISAIRFCHPIQGAELNELVWSPRDGPRPILQLPAFGI